MAASVHRPYGAIGRIGVVAAMHVGVLYVIAASLGIAPPLVLKPEPITLQPTLPIVEPPPQRIEPIIERAPDPILIAPEPLFPDADPLPSDSITGNVLPVDQIPVQQTGSAVPQPVISAPAIDPRRPLSRPDYPADAIRASAEGSAVVEIYVLENGRVGDVRIVKSSGWESLDKATIAEARRNWRLKPATRDGVAIAQWHRLSVAFRLEDARRN